MSKPTIEQRKRAVVKMLKFLGSVAAIALSIYTLAQLVGPELLAACVAIALFVLAVLTLIYNGCMDLVKSEDGEVDDYPDFR